MSVNLTIDQGNSRAKIAVSDGTRLLEQRIPQGRDALRKAMLELIAAYRPACGLYSCVGQFDPQLPVLAAEAGCRLEVLTHETPLPIDLNYGYEAAKLGADRIAALMGARHIYPHGPVLVVDIGTAITYDVLTADNRFAGGTINAGPLMRTKALHQYTSRLPEIDASLFDDNDVSGWHFALGHDTMQAIYAGVRNGIEAEIEYYKANIEPYDGLRQCIVTGGMCHLAKFGNTIAPDLLRLGMIHIIEYNIELNRNNENK